MKLFLDLDGVIVDFVGGILSQHSLQMPTFDGVYELNKIFGFDVLKDVQSEFWAWLDWTHDGRHILQLAKRYFNDIYLVTSLPSFVTEDIEQDVPAAIGKLEWVSREIPELRSKLVLCTDKNFGAASNHILLDDSVTNVNNFRREGGRAILVPRPWNVDRDKDVLTTVERNLQCYSDL